LLFFVDGKETVIRKVSLLGEGKDEKSNKNLVGGNNTVCDARDSTGGCTVCEHISIVQQP
jgi:hypothetical protein